VVVSFTKAAFLITTLKTVLALDFCASHHYIERMRSLLFILALSFAPAFALVDPMDKSDSEALKKIVAGQDVELNSDQNTRIYTAVKSAAAAQPQDLLELGKNAQKIADKVAKEEKLDDDSVLQSMAIFKTLEANQINFSLRPHTDEEKEALKKIDALHEVIKSKM